METIIDTSFEMTCWALAGLCLLLGWVLWYTRDKKK